MSIDVCNKNKYRIKMHQYMNLLQIITNAEKLFWKQSIQKLKTVTEGKSLYNYKKHIFSMIILFY